MRNGGSEELIDRTAGCLLGGALGDALGASVEFLALDAICAAYGPRGIEDFAPAYGRLGAITDDTQMTLFHGGRRSSRPCPSARKRDL